MTSFVHTTYPTEHAGVVRATQAAETLKHAASGFEGTRGAAALLLAAIVSALLVVANQVIETWSEGGLLAAWMGLWLVAFAALALLAAPARRAAVALRSGYKAWVESRRLAAEDERTWALARKDARLMADLMRIMEASASSVRRYD
jgi:hypothetical protein